MKIEKKSLLDYRYTTFYTVCQTLNYTRASELLRITQPSVSNHIAFLENNLGFRLFEKKDRKLILTKKAEFLYRKLDYLIGLSNDTIKKIQEIDKNKIKIGSTSTISDDVIFPFLVKLIRIKSELVFDISVDNTDHLIQKIKNHNIDGAFIIGDVVLEKGIKMIPIAKEKLIGICSSQNLLAKGKFLIDDIKEQHLLIREQGSSIREITEKYLYKNGLLYNDFKKMTILGSEELVKKMVIENIGISFVLESDVLQEIEKGLVSPINFPEEGPNQTINFVYLKDSERMLSNTLLNIESDSYENLKLN